MVREGQFGGVVKPTALTTPHSTTIPGAGGAVPQWTWAQILLPAAASILHRDKQGHVLSLPVGHLLPLLFWLLLPPRPELQTPGREVVLLTVQGQAVQIPMPVVSALLRVFSLPTRQHFITSEKLLLGSGVTEASRSLRVCGCPSVVITQG